MKRILLSALFIFAAIAIMRAQDADAQYAKELLMGASPEEQARAMKEYIRKDIIPAYAENFNKGLQADNIEYYVEPDV